MRLEEEPQVGAHVKALTHAVKALAGRTWSVSIVDLGSFSLRCPITVRVEEFEREVIASWSEVEAFGSGDTEAEAVNALKDEIVGLYNDLEASPDETLGELPRRWLRALRAIVTDASTSST